ncbi:DUF3467 domain-containing protein [Methanomicrobium antiquum]|uniref:DUF3467 domain-containing protein n=1 Tax=Methanomicrobium antiquum TaxID=487686 RepID=A0AAF0FVI1_9EURY|nr:DUF3467 domain-containing protein [Methanomicrobium antiquum]WFN36695.1 DUF3467 domain-containing protein [Methanomicrobium antiquum]
MAKNIKTADTESMTIDVGEMYKYKKEDLMTDISSSAYSNLAYVQATHRDLYIDFLEMPGIKRDDGKMHIKGTRIYMSHSAAQKLSKALDGILKMVHSDGGMEFYTPEDETKPKISTKVQQATTRNKI